MKKLFLVLLALTFPGCETASKENTDCSVPSGTYAYLTYQTWNNLNYGLPWCWVATEVMDKNGTPALLRLDHGEGEISLEITVTQNQGDPTAMWGPPENLYGEYYYYDFLIDENTAEFMRFESGTKISVVSQSPVPESVQQNLYDILSSLSLSVAGSSFPSSP